MAQLRPLEICTAQICPNQASATHIRTAQIRSMKICPTEEYSSEIRALEIQLDLFMREIRPHLKL